MAPLELFYHGLWFNGSDNASIRSRDGTVTPGRHRHDRDRPSGGCHRLSGPGRGGRAAPRRRGPSRRTRT
eukprot:762159-Hanusia_phi.AAC.1